MSHLHAVSAFSRATVPSGGLALASSSRTAARLSKSMPPSSQASSGTPAAASSRRVGSATLLTSTFRSVSAVAAPALDCAPGMWARCGMGDRV